VHLVELRSSSSKIGCTSEVPCHGEMSTAGNAEDWTNVETDVERFREFYESCFGRISAYVIRRTKTKDDAADVIAETFEVAWRKFASIPRGDVEILWLYGVARRVLANQRRSSMRREQLVRKVALDLPSLTEDADGDSSWQLVRTVLSQLSSSDQDLITLAYWEDLSSKEIAYVLETSPGTVRVRLLRARRRFESAFVESSNSTQDDGATDFGPNVNPAHVEEAGGLS
jgi:RNA polymerase sigma factor (sigma-70 family)